MIKRQTAQDLKRADLAARIARVFILAGWKPKGKNHLLATAKMIGAIDRQLRKYILFHAPKKS